MYFGAQKTTPVWTGVQILPLEGQRFKSGGGIGLSARVYGSSSVAELRRSLQHAPLYEQKVAFDRFPFFSKCKFSLDCCEYQHEIIQRSVLSLAKAFKILAYFYNFILPLK